MGLCPRKPHTWSTFCCCCFIVYEEHLTWVIYILYSYSPCHNECTGEESLHEGKQTSCMTVTFHTYVECLRPYKETCQTSDLFAWFTAALLSDFSLPAAIPNFKCSSPGGACRSVVSGFLIVYQWSFFFSLFLLSIWTSDNIFNILFYFLFSAWYLQLHCAAPSSHRKGTNSHPIQSFLNSLILVHEVFSKMQQHFSKSDSSVSLQLYERERAGARAAGEDTTGQSKHHHRLFQQGPVVPANTSPCTRHTDTYTYIHMSVVLWAQVGGQNKFYLCIFCWNVYCCIFFFKWMELLKV